MAHLELVAAPAGYDLENLQGLCYDFRPDPVAGQYADQGCHARFRSNAAMASPCLSR